MPSSTSSNAGHKMGAAEQPCYTLIYPTTDDEQYNEIQLKQDLEKGSIKEKQEALRKVIQLILSGEKMPNLLMIIIRFVMPSQDHVIKKLLLIFWEVVPKYSQDGKLMQEMILVCDAYRKDLQHPNEYIRGSTLRFLCKLKEAELLEPLMPAIRTCLEHRHSYVRRNAVLAIFTIFRNFEFLIPDAPELVANFLEAEQDASCKRNAFMMLIHADQDRALNYLSSCIDQVNGFGDILQLVIVELIYKVCHANPSERGRFIRCIYNLLNSSSAAVRYEAAGTLVTLSIAPTAIKAAASAYIELVLKESDNNVKLIVLDRLVQLKDNHDKVLQELIMDIVRILSAPDLDVRKKTLDLILDLISSRNIEELVQVLRKEIVKTNNVTEQEDMGKYRQFLVRTLHRCTIKFPDQAAAVIPVLIEFLSDQNESAASDVLIFIREAMQKFNQHRVLIVEKLVEIFSSIKSVKIYRAAIWILGEYCSSVDDLQSVMNLIRQSLGELPIVEDEQRQLLAESSGDDRTNFEQQMNSGNTPQRLVTADGTYATQSALIINTTQSKKEKPALRQFLSDGDFFVGAAISTTLAKMALRYLALVNDESKQNRFVAECLYIISCIIHYGKSGMPSKSINDDDYDRLCLSMRMLCEQLPFLRNAYVSDCRTALKNMICAVAKEELEEKEISKKLDSSKNSIKIQADSPVTFSQLLDKNELGVGEDLFELTLSQALGIKGSGDKKDDLVTSSKLNKVTQLTGFSDPIYAEAYVNVNQYDIVLDVLIVNQTADTLQNVILELATLGDLKLVEKPQPVMLAPNDFTNIRASVKVASTENGIIFGNIVYDVTSSSGGNCVVLSDLHIDIMDYLLPSTCTDSDFRQMWAEFEWENKVSVNTQLTDLQEYLQQLLKATNMRCLTPPAALHGQCGFLAANLYAKSIFGEHALANVSIELPIDNNKSGMVQGHIRIRAKSQGMALSLGDKVNVSQKKFKSDNNVSNIDNEN